MGTAGLYASSGPTSWAVVQIVVYAGGVVILMLFAVMLTGGAGNSVARLGLEKIPAMGNRKTRLFSLASVAVVFLVIIKLFMNGLKDDGPKKELGPYESTVEEIGILLVSDHVLAFEISSIPS